MVLAYNARSPGFHHQHCTNQRWWNASLILGLERLKWEDQKKFKLRKFKAYEDVLSSCFIYDAVINQPDQ